MSSIAPFLRNAVFDDDAVRIMSLAYDKALATLPDKSKRAAVVQDIVATRIITFATHGERDPEKLAQKALEVFPRPDQ
jgi:hypothetical protein